MSETIGDLRAWLRHHRKMVWVIVCLLFVVLVLLRLYVFPEVDDRGNRDPTAVVKSFLDGLMAAIFISSFVTIAVAWLRPPVGESLSEKLIQSYEIDGTLRESAQNTREWYYLGHTGRYVRSQIFPAVNADSRARNENKKIRVIILDPTNAETCAFYARYRNDSRSGQNAMDVWTGERVCAELIATVLCMIELHQANTMLEVSAGLIERVSLFRTDMNSSIVLVTQEDNQELAIRYANGSQFYRYYRREMELAWSQAKQLKINGALLLNLEDLDSVRACLSRVGLDESVFDNEMLTAACREAKRKASPYVRR